MFFFDLRQSNLWNISGRTAGKIFLINVSQSSDLNMNISEWILIEDRFARDANVTWEATKIRFRFCNNEIESSQRRMPDIFVPAKFHYPTRYWHSIIHMGRARCNRHYAHMYIDRLLAYDRRIGRRYKIPNNADTRLGTMRM